MLRESLKIHSWMPYYELPVTLKVDDIIQRKRGSIAKWDEPLQTISLSLNHKENKDLTAVV